MDLFWCCDKASNKYAPADVQYSNVPQSHAAIEFSRSHSVDCPTRNGSRILIKTGGTALQAVPREAALEPDMISGKYTRGCCGLYIGLLNHISLTCLPCCCRIC
jgi:hypothetical protein